MSAIN